MNASLATRPPSSAPARTWRLTALFGGSLVALACCTAVLTVTGAPGLAATACAVVALAALLSGIAGLAFSPLCGAVLFHLPIEHVAVVQILLVCSIANQCVSVWALRRDIVLSRLAPFLAAGALAVPAGAALLLEVHSQAYIRATGLILVAYAAFMLAAKPLVLARAPRWGDLLAGFTGGLLAGFAATPGPAVAIWCGVKGWNKAQQRAVFQPFILIMQCLALATIAVAHPGGPATLAVPALAWACVPASLCGTCWGLACFRRITDRQFATALKALLLVSGLALLA